MTEERLTPAEEQRVGSVLELGKLQEVDAQPDPATVKYFEDLLRRAKTGEIRGFAIVIQKGGLATANGWAGIDINCMSIIGEVEAMKVDLIRANVQQRYDCCGYTTE